MFRGWPTANLHNRKPFYFSERMKDMESIKKYSTAQLVEELCSREGIKCSPGGVYREYALEEKYGAEKPDIPLKYCAVIIPENMI